MMPATRRAWVLERHPEGTDFAGALSLKTLPLTLPAPGEVILRNHWLSMDAGTRLWMTAREDGYSPPAPLGQPMTGLTLATVIASAHPAYQPGNTVRAFGQWADHSVVMPDVGYIVPVDMAIADPREHLGLFGATGWTAYHGITAVAEVQAGQTVVVSAAAGATGVLAVQIAQRLGARVIGIVGSAEKEAWLRQEFGVAGTVSHRDPDVAARLREQCPDGIHAYFDNVGGPLLDAVLPNMALHGRVAVCGLVAGYDRDTPLPGPASFDQVLMKRLRIEGFFSPEFFGEAPRINAVLAGWAAEGRLRMPFEVVDGLESTLSAYARLFTGKNRGKVLVRLA